MYFFLSKASRSNNSKNEPNILDEDPAWKVPPACEGLRLFAGGSEPSRGLIEPQHMPAYQSTAHSSNRVEPRASMIPPVTEAAHKLTIRVMPSSARKESHFSSRSEPSLVASDSYGVRQSRRSASSSERCRPEPPIPLFRSTTISTLDEKYTIPHKSFNSRTTLEPVLHNRFILPYVPDYSRAASQQMPPPHTSRSSKPCPAQRARTSSGTISEDRPVTVVDMKRLLSKPALPSSAITAIPSPQLPQSDSEFSSSGSQAGQSQTFTSRSVSTPNVVKAVRRRVPLESQDEDSPTAISLVRVTRMSSPSLLSSSPEESLPLYRGFPSLSREQKQSPALRRRPSGSGSPSLRSPIKLDPTTKLAGSSGRQTMSHLTIEPTLSRRSGGCRGEASQSTSSSPLTPAGAVAEAYKQQEQKRDYLSLQASGSGEEETSGIAECLFPDQGNERASRMAYYAVSYGSPSRPVLGGQSDKHIDASMINPQCASPDSRQGHGLKRRVSSGWKKATSGNRGDEISAVNGDLTLRVRGRRSISLPREKTKPFGRSLDIRPLDSHLTGESIPSIQYMFPAKATASVAVEKDVRGKPGKLIKAKADHGEKDEDSNKIWKLVKRISTGGLRERYQIDGSPPPVPPLPKNIPISNGDSLGVLPPWTKPQSANSTTSKGFSASVSPRASPSRRIGPWSPSGSRPSIVTGYSSSPGSSDLPSTQLFHRTHSTKSSSSSNCEGTSPVPTTMIGRHIIPPDELRRMNIEYEAEVRSPITISYTPQRSMSPPDRDSLPPPDYWPEYTRPSLPHPPRRAANQGTHQRDKSSPEPTFSSKGKADNLLTNKNNAQGHKPPNSPPAHLSKGLRRQRLGSLSVSTQSSSCPPSTSIRTPLPDGSQDSHFEAGNSDRTSSGAVSSASTARQHTSLSKSSFLGDLSTLSKSPTRSPLNFRELGTSPHAALTAKEKADIWNDLLERSDRAGGTLHMGGQELMSEQMRLSPSLSN